MKNGQQRRFSFQSWWYWFSGKENFSHSRTSTTRKLLTESLETRYALSTLDGGPDVGGDSSIPPDANIADYFSVPPEGSTSSEGEQQPGDPPPGDPPPPPPTNPPYITDFAGELQENWCSLSGQVIDDLDPTGLTVYFGGLLEGETDVVNENDMFDGVFELPPGAEGEITAYTIDADGNLSPLVTWTV